MPDLEVLNCSFGGRIETNDMCGGVIGYHGGESFKIENCSNNGQLTSNGKMGGIAGSLVYSGYDSDKRKILNCDNRGTIICKDSEEEHGENVGGICGEGRSLTILRCSNLGQIITNYSKYVRWCRGTH